MLTLEPALTLEHLNVSYGHVRAVEDVSFMVTRGETVALLGPNGAGKSTLLRTISNQTSKSSGRVIALDRDISSMRSDRILRLGVAHVPEGRQVVAPLTVEENLVLAARASCRCPRQEVRQEIEGVYELFPKLAAMRNSLSGLLSGGEQQMVAIGRALVAKPSVLLLDEPSMGLAPVMVDVIYEFLADRRRVLPNVSILLAEQSQVALSVADRTCVLSRGRVVFDGAVSDLTGDKALEAYFGTSAPTAEVETA